NAAYDRYCGTISQSTVVDTGACIDALSVLCNDTDKRHAMGEAGRTHARATYDWSIVIKAHQDVWEELDRRRSRAAMDARHTHRVPDISLHSDPFAMFGAYPTSVINDATELRLIDGVDLSLLDKRLSMTMNTFAMDRLLSRNNLAKVIAVLLERGMASVQDIVDLFDQATHAQVVLSIGWLAKMHLLRLSGSITAVLSPDQRNNAQKPARHAEQGASDEGALT
ncbi:MAG: glycosyltransferase, partial [Rhodospirillales bacterium]|nr:glycosyltransferase [Rhodospirillales bacterium]